jgi:hypothetical protein
MQRWCDLFAGSTRDSSQLIIILIVIIVHKYTCITQLMNLKYCGNPSHIAARK